jgi:glucose/mannose-6-phosphate isomerase
MLDAALSLAAHARDGYAAGLAATSLPPTEGVRSIAICGMGGSAIAGDVIRAISEDRLGIPFAVVRSPELPAFASADALVVASSYSGNTAETLAVLEQALERGCRAIAVTSGGKLAGRAEERGIGLVGVPAGFVPRAAFGFLTLGALGALEATGLLHPQRADVEEAANELEALANLTGADATTSRNPAKALALAIGERIPVVWGAEGIGAVAAMRWKAEMNENAKVPAFWSSLPELDHNEVEGWSDGQGERFIVIALRHEGEHPEVAARFPLSLDVARSSGAAVEEVWARGGSALARLLTLVLLGDVTATYLAIARGVDPTAMDTITRLKRALAGTP